jgi:hypothetical protein
MTVEQHAALENLVRAHWESGRFYQENMETFAKMSALDAKLGDAQNEVSDLFEESGQFLVDGLLVTVDGLRVSVSEVTKVN